MSFTANKSSYCVAQSINPCTAMPVPGTVWMVIAFEWYYHLFSFHGCLSTHLDNFYFVQIISICNMLC